MYASDTVIENACHGCGASLRIATRDAGQALAKVTPAGAILWAARHYAGACAATSLCPGTVFYCGDDHLSAWRRRNPGAEGFRLTMDEGLELGRALFGKQIEPSRSDA